MNFDIASILKNADAAAEAVKIAQAEHAKLKKDVVNAVKQLIQQYDLTASELGLIAVENVVVKEKKTSEPALVVAIITDKGIERKILKKKDAEEVKASSGATKAETIAALSAYKGNLADLVVPAQKANAEAIVKMLEAFKNS